jgi:hypothetical protein
MSELEETPPFAQRVERLLNIRYSEAEPSEMVDYILDPARVGEARRVEQYVWAFRVSETLREEGPAIGIGRVDAARPLRLAECLKPPRFSKWGLPEMLVSAELNDLLIAYGYDLGIGAEAEGATQLRLGEMDETEAWEMIVALCQASTETLTGLFDMGEDLLPYVYGMATSNIRKAAERQKMRVTRNFPETAQLLVNAGLLMRAVQQDIGPRLHAAVPEGRLAFVRNNWATPVHWTTSSRH